MSITLQRWRVRDNFVFRTLHQWKVLRVRRYCILTSRKQSYIFGRRYSWIIRSKSAKTRVFYLKNFNVQNRRPPQILFLKSFLFPKLESAYSFFGVVRRYWRDFETRIIGCRYFVGFGGIPSEFHFAEFGGKIEGSPLTCPKTSPWGWFLLNSSRCWLVRSCEPTDTPRLKKLTWNWPNYSQFLLRGICQIIFDRSHSKSHVENVAR